MALHDYHGEVRKKRGPRDSRDMQPYVAVTTVIRDAFGIELRNAHVAIMGLPPFRDPTTERPP